MAMMQRRSDPADAYAACPKCQGQYRLQGTQCQCYQCSFEWDMAEPTRQVYRRARRRARSARPPHPLWSESIHEPEAFLEDGTDGTKGNAQDIIADGGA